MGPGRVGPERLPAARAVAWASGSFNGAGARRPRKTSPSIFSSVHVIVLQWGRGA